MKGKPTGGAGVGRGTVSRKGLWIAGSRARLLPWETGNRKVRGITKEMSLN